MWVHLISIYSTSSGVPCYALLSHGSTSIHNFFSLFGLFVGLYMLNPGVMQSNLNFAIFLVVLGDKITINERKAIG